jgi:phosphinothricin acetyltransferase
MTSADVSRVNTIYNHYIEHSHITFDIDPWLMERRMEWFEARRDDERYPLLVAVDSGAVAGGAWAGPYRPKPAYYRSVETTVVVDPAAIGKGFGQRLLAELIARLRVTPAHRAYAVVALPNAASIAIHHQLGYRTVGVLSDSGHKFGRYWSTELLELELSTD